MCLDRVGKCEEVLGEPMMKFNYKDQVIIPEDGTYHGKPRKWQVIGTTPTGFVYLSSPGMDEVAEERVIDASELVLCNE